MLMDKAALITLDLPPSYPGGGFGPLFARDLLSHHFLEQKSHWYHQGKSLLAMPLILMGLQKIHSTMNEPLILSAFKTFPPVDTSGRWPKNGQPQKGLGVSWWENNPSMAQQALTCHWRTKPKERDKLLDTTTVDPSPSSPTTSFVHSHDPHSVQSHVVQAKQNNLTSQTRIP